MDIQRGRTNARMSQIVIHGETVYLAGQVADERGAGVAGQTEQVLAKIDALLAEAGSGRARILSATVWLADIATFNEMNAVWDAWVPQGQAPARACVENALAAPDILVEIGIIAAR